MSAAQTAVFPLRPVTARMPVLVARPIPARRSVTTTHVASTAAVATAVVSGAPGPGACPERCSAEASCRALRAIPLDGSCNAFPQWDLRTEAEEIRRPGRVE